MNVQQLDLQDIEGSNFPVSAPLTVLVGKHEEISKLQFASPGINPSLPLRETGSEDWKSSLRHPSHAFFENYAHSFEYEGLSVVCVREDVGFTNMRESSWWDSTYDSRPFNVPGKELPEIKKENLSEDIVNEILKQNTVTCGCVTAGPVQQYQNLDERVLGGECNRPAEYAVSVSMPLLDLDELMIRGVEGVKYGKAAYVNTILYFCENHAEAFSLNPWTGKENNPARLYLENEMIKVMVDGADINMDVSKIENPSRPYIAEGLSLPGHLEFDNRRMEYLGPIPGRRFYDLWPMRGPSGLYPGIEKELSESWQRRIAAIKEGVVLGRDSNFKRPVKIYTA